MMVDEEPTSMVARLAGSDSTMPKRRPRPVRERFQPMFGRVCWPLATRTGQDVRKAPMLRADNHYNSLSLRTSLMM